MACLYIHAHADPAAWNESHCMEFKKRKTTHSTLEPNDTLNFGTTLRKFMSNIYIGDGLGYHCGRNQMPCVAVGPVTGTTGIRDY